MLQCLVPAHRLDQPERALRPDIAKDRPGIGPSHAERSVEDLRQHGAQIQCRADRLSDLAQHLQLFDRAPEFGGPIAQFADQARILDRDHRLVGKGRDQLDFAFRRRLRLAAGPEPMTPIRHRLAQQRHAHHRMYAADPGIVLEPRNRVGQASRIWTVRASSAARPTPCRGPGRIRTFRSICSYSGGRIRPTAQRYSPSHCGKSPPGRLGRAAIAVDTSVCSTGSRSKTEPADDLQHVAGRGLVFERLLQIVGALPQFANSRAFSIAITACAGEVL